MSKEQTPTPHIEAKYGDFAKTLLMPGDPKRAQLIADTFLEDCKKVNDVRGIVGFTGKYKGKEISVMASGMGMPSIGIYSYELFNFYDVDNIIRVGTCGAYSEKLHTRDILIGMGVCMNSSFHHQYELPGMFAPIANFDLVKFCVEEASKKDVHFEVGNILSSDVFYEHKDYTKAWTDMGVLGVEMEAGALYCNAARAGKRALTLCTVSDSFIYDEIMTPEERQNSLMTMLEIGVDTAAKAADLPVL